MTVVLGGLLAFTAVSLKPQQDKEIALDTKRSILKSVGIVSDDKGELAKIYDERIQSIVVDSKGEEVASGYSKKPGAKPEDVNINAEWKKKDDTKKFLPVFKLMKEGSKEEVEAYIVPIYGYGLWNNIWGYLAVNPDLESVKGVAFDHAGETPGLGARITTDEITKRYEGKKLVKDGSYVHVDMIKGEGNADVSDYQVDGMSGATLTAVGVNNMFKDYITLYAPYFGKLKGQPTAASK